MDLLIWGTILVHTLTNTFGLVLNGCLIFAVLKKTPNQISSYSTLIFNFAMCDFSACLAALFVQQRLIPSGFALFYFSHGPCRLFGPLACYIGYSFMLHCYAHMQWSLLFSFAYRYCVISRTHPRRPIIILIIFLIYTPSFLQFVSFCFASDRVDDVKIMVEKKFGYDTSSECVSGHLNIFNWKALYTIFHMTLPITPIYIAILILRRGTLSKLYTARELSENTRRAHSQLLKALTIQACLPVFFMLGVITYALGQLDIYHHPILECATFILIGLIPMFSPLTSLYFISPYRRWVCSVVLRHQKVTPSVTATRASATNI